MKVLFIIVFLISTQSFATQSRGNYSGFYNPKDVVGFPLNSDMKNSVFKIVIHKEAGMFGTAYSLQEDVLLTNVHNITQCLIDYGLVDFGYDGSKGPLKCKSLSLKDGKGVEVNSVELLGSNPRRNNDDKDFAVIKVKGLKADPIRLNPNGPQVESSVFIVGFPSTTYRSPEKLDEKMISMVSTIEVIFAVENKITELGENSSSQDLFTAWMADGFKKLQPLVKWNEFLSGSIMGRDWNPLLAWQNEDSSTYRKNLMNHIKRLKADAYTFIQLIEKSQLMNGKNNLDADDTLKVSYGKVSEISGNAVLIEGDATPGSSGSVVLDSSGSSVGILFQIRRVGKNENDICLLDAIMTDFESIRFSYCPSLGPTTVSSKIIFETIRSWGIKL
ncbi:MAG: hypothetical protein JNM24_07450 [Bdellovibrionaceae bacterium]|nr:hypothetical protein [Pseudobdellovibrionaceae bacterium]